MITNITKEQQDKKQVYRDKWTIMSQDTTKVDREKVEKLYPEIFEGKVKNFPKEVRWADSPKQCLDMITDEFNISREDAFYGFCFGQQDSTWVGFYNYFEEVLGLRDEVKPAKALIELSKHVGWFIPAEEVIFFCERPLELHIKSGENQYHIINETPNKPIIDGKLHHDGGASVKYRDGFCMYHLNGVAVPKWLAVTPAQDIDVKELDNITNIKVRKQFLIKVD